MSVPIGILSTAHVHTDGFAGLLSSNDEVEFVGIADEDEQRGTETAQRYDVPYMETEELLSRVDGALVFSTNTTHRPWVERAARAGVDVLCEKPLATELGEAQAIVDCVEENGIDLGMVMPLPFSQPARRAKRELSGNAIGDLKLATGTNRAKLRNRHETGWSATPEHSGGGAVMDHTAHIVGLLRWLTGQEIREVHAELATMHDGVGVEDVNLLSMELDDGTPFTLDGSWSRPEENDYWGDATLRLVGTDGTLAIDCYDYKLTVTRDAGEDPGVSSAYWGELPNAALLADFLEAVNIDRAPEITARDGLKEAAVCVAAYESARIGGPVTVEYPD